MAAEHWSMSQMVRAVAVGAMAAAALLVPHAALADMSPSWFGTWSVNFSKSNGQSGPQPFKRITCTIEPSKDGFKVSYDMVGIRGGVTHLEWVGKDDGADYRLEGAEAVMTNAYRRIADRTYDVLQKVDGQLVASARTVLASDGNSITTVTRGKDAQGRTVTTTLLYERQK
jgi:hypothetical protein